LVVFTIKESKGLGKLENFFMYSKLNVCSYQLIVPSGSLIDDATMCGLKSWFITMDNEVQ